MRPANRQNSGLAKIKVTILDKPYATQKIKKKLRPLCPITSVILNFSQPLIHWLVLTPYSFLFISSGKKLVPPPL